MQYKSTKCSIGSTRGKQGGCLSCPPPHTVGPHSVLASRVAAYIAPPHCWATQRTGLLLSCPLAYAHTHTNNITHLHSLTQHMLARSRQTTYQLGNANTALHVAKHMVVAHGGSLYGARARGGGGLQVQQQGPAAQCCAGRGAKVQETAKHGIHSYTCDARAVLCAATGRGARVRCSEVPQPPPCQRPR